MPPYKAVADIPEQVVEVGKKLEWMSHDAMVAANVQFWEQAVRTDLGILFMPENIQCRDGRWRWRNEAGTVTVITRTNGMIESIDKPVESCTQIPRKAEDGLS